MANSIVRPKAGVSVETCIMGEWMIQVGGPVKAGDLVFTYETDKSSFEYRAAEEGTLLAVFFQEGDDVPVLTPVCVIGDPGEDISALLPEKPDAAAESGAETAPLPEPASAAAEPLPAASVRGEDGILRISPRARLLAEKMDIRPLEQIPATGPEGRIIERDVRRFARSGEAQVQAAGSAQPPDVSPAAPAQEEYEDKKLSNIRRVIASNMQQSLATMAQLTHNTSFDTANIMAYRSELKAVAAQRELPNITINDIIIYAVSRTLLRHPELNAHFLGERMRYFRHVHMGVAVDTPRGLMVPTIFYADRKSLKEIAAEMKQLSADCQSGSVSPDKLSGASFTISNLGTFGIEHFTPVINPPQTGILGVDCVTERVRRVDGAIQTYPAMGLSLTYDHRALDGAPASRFLQELCRGLEHFTALLAE